MNDARSVLDLTRQLIRQNTISPPGNEFEAAVPIGRMLESAGYRVELRDYAPGRTSLIADLDGSGNDLPLCFTGHFDTVPLGAAAWSVDPFAAEISGEKLYGRGSTDMKGGIAAIVEAAVRISRRARKRGVKLVLTAGEETGCEGAAYLAQTGLRGKAGALVVAEPTSNAPLLGHRGVLWLKIEFAGKTAHSSMPHLGENAVVKAAHAITKIDRFDFGFAEHPYLGAPTLNISRCRGGLNINSVPDHAEVTIDMRTVPDQSHDHICGEIAKLAPDASQATRLFDFKGVFTAPEDPWIQSVFAAVESVTGKFAKAATAPYFTDAPALHPELGLPPTVILGPGELSMAHQTDEYCLVGRLTEAVEIYEMLLADWCES